MFFLFLLCVLTFSMFCMGSKSCSKNYQKIQNMSQKISKMVQTCLKRSKKCPNMLKKSKTFLPQIPKIDLSGLLNYQGVAEMEHKGLSCVLFFCQSFFVLGFSLLDLKKIGEDLLEIWERSLVTPGIHLRSKIQENFCQTNPESYYVALLLNGLLLFEMGSRKQDIVKTENKYQSPIRRSAKINI